MSAKTFPASPTMRALAAAVRANVPVLVWGHPGVCKTASLGAYADAWGYHFEPITGANREATDFLGLPIQTEDNEVVYAKLAWVSRLVAADKSLLFLDELTTVPPSVQKAMLRILEERQVGETYLPPSVAIVAAANPPSSAVDGYDLPPAVANRLMHLDWVLDSAEWLEGLLTDFAFTKVPALDDLLSGGTDADKARVKAMVASFLRTRPDLLHKMPADPTEAGRGWPSPRSWTKCAAVLSELDRGDEEAINLVLVGCVGEAASNEFLAWYVAQDLYDPEAVLADPSIVDWTERPDRIFALTSALVAIAQMRHDKATWRKVMVALTACAKAGRPDLAYPGARQLLQEVPDGAELPDGTAKAFADLMVKTGKWAA